MPIKKQLLTPTFSTGYKSIRMMFEDSTISTAKVAQAKGNPRKVSPNTAASSLNTRAKSGSSSAAKAPPR